MPTKKNSRAQAKKARANLQKLKAAGLYSGKIDRRKNLTPSQKRLVSKFKDVLTGKARALKPANPKEYKGVFPVKGGVVIVPRRKGERFIVNKAGEIVSNRKVMGVSVSARYEKTGKVTAKTIDHNATYAIPFIRGRDAKGKPILEWKRIPGKGLLKVMQGYDYKNWQKFVVIERTV